MIDPANYDAYFQLANNPEYAADKADDLFRDAGFRAYWIANRDRVSRNELNFAKNPASPSAAIEAEEKET